MVENFGTWLPKKSEFQQKLTKPKDLLNWSKQYDFNLVCHPTWKKMSPGGIQTRDPDHESRTYTRSRPLGYGPAFTGVIHSFGRSISCSSHIPLFYYSCWHTFHCNQTNTILWSLFYKFCPSGFLFVPSSGHGLQTHRSAKMRRVSSASHSQKTYYQNSLK